MNKKIEDEMKKQIFIVFHLSSATEKYQRENTFSKREMVDFKLGILGTSDLTFEWQQKICDVFEPSAAPSSTKPKQQQPQPTQQQYTRTSPKQWWNSYSWLESPIMDLAKMITDLSWCSFFNFLQID